MYVTSLEEDAVKIREGEGPLAVLVQNNRLRWPDSFAEGPGWDDLRDFVTHGHGLVQAGERAAATNATMAHRNEGLMNSSLRKSSVDSRF